MDASTYGERVAQSYDDDHAFLATGTDRTVALLAELAAPGNRVLELGVGTGRVALPLAARGVAVTGLDASPAMLARLAAKPGGDAVRTILGDMAVVPVEGMFDLVYVIFNTFFALLTQEAQIGCLSAAAARLAPDGKLVIEAFVPDHTLFTRGQAWRTRAVHDDGVIAEASRHEPILQRVETNLVRLRDGRPVEIVPIRIRYAHVAELDLMARVAGLGLLDRWAGWGREPFGPGARLHVSVYQRG